MIRPLTAFGQAFLLAALLMIPGLGTVDFCLAKNQVCREAKVEACCCEHKKTQEDRVPCCVTVHQDWMVPTKELAKVTLPLLPCLMPAWTSEPLQPAPRVSTVFPGRFPLEPPPPARDLYLALIQVRLV